MNIKISMNMNISVHISFKIRISMHTNTNVHSNINIHVNTNIVILMTIIMIDNNNLNIHNSTVNLSIYIRGLRLAFVCNESEIRSLAALLS